MIRTVLVALSIIMLTGGSAFAGKTKPAPKTPVIVTDESMCRDKEGVPGKFLPATCGAERCEFIEECANGATYFRTQSHGYIAAHTCGDIPTMWRELGFSKGYWVEYGKSCKVAGLNDSKLTAKLSELAKKRPAKIDSAYPPIEAAAAQLFVLQGYLNVEESKVHWGTHCENSICRENMPSGSTYVHADAGASALRYQVENAPISTDSELTIIARGRGLKIGDKQTLARILQGGAKVAMIATRNQHCVDEEIKESGLEATGIKWFTSWMYRIEVLMTEGLHEVPAATTALAKTFAEQAGSRYDHVGTCKLHERDEEATQAYYDALDAAREEKEKLSATQGKK